ncbi:MAG: ABC transporter permease [Bacteroidales bacterium]|jgi:putative ABC transport system permease protein
MIKYDFLFALRSLRKQRLFSLVNLFGLSLGIVSVCLILIYVQKELSFDRFNKNADRIFRVYSSFEREGKSEDWVQTATPMAAFIQDKTPEVENTVRIAKVPKGLVGYGENHFFEENMVLADASVFDVFTFPLLSGDPRSVLENPNSVVISKTIAEKYFGKENPLGKTISYNRNISLTVSGIMKDIPRNTHLPCEMIASMATAKAFFGNDFLTNPMNTIVFTYLLTHKGIRGTQLEEAVNKLYGKSNFGNMTYHMQSLPSIHLYSNRGGEYQPNGDIRTVYIFSAIAVLILLIACINYINLSLSLNKKRSTELGVRKVMGAGATQLIHLFLSNAFVLATISVLASFVAIWLLLPGFSRLSGVAFRFSNLGIRFYLGLILFFSLIVLATGLSSGWLAARLKPVTTLRKSGAGKNKNIGIHGLMVLFQFTISIVLIAATLLVNRQMNLLKNKNLGFSKEQLLVIPVNDQNLKSRIQSFKQDLLANPNILSASATSDLPGKMLWITSINYEGQNEQSAQTMNYLEIDKDFLTTYGVQLKEGYIPGDTACPYNGTQYLLNETAVKKLGWKQPLGEIFSCYNGKQGHVVGIVHDFNFKSLHESVEPLFLYMKEGVNNYLTLKLDTRDLTKTVSFAGQQWSKIAHESPFEYFFYDDFYDQLYRSEARFSQIILIFSCIAILIACLGIFGLATFLSETRTKEIGIRKVNGARISEILTMLNSDFIKWVAIAFIIATPIAYYAMNNWLENFAYKTTLSWWIFALAGLLALGIALLTVSWQSWKAATRNPVEALRYE